MPKRSESVRIGSRGSELALWQARWVQSELLRLHPGLEVTVTVIRTKGDRVLDSPLSTIGDKGLFTRELEVAMQNHDIDLAVHSLKDLPTELPDGLALGAVCRREDVRDVFIPHPGNPNRKLLEQHNGARIGTGSLRRKCQLLNLRPDFEVIDIRGNLNTRFRKLDESDWAGMILARAGVIRLGLGERIGETIAADVILPAVGQGALAVEIRKDDRAVSRMVSGLNHTATVQATTAERALLRRLEGGCQVPIGTFGRFETRGEPGVGLSLDAMVGSLDGKSVVRGKTHGDPEHADEIGRRLAETLLKAGAYRILQAIREHAPGYIAEQSEV